MRTKESILAEIESLPVKDTWRTDWAIKKTLPKILEADEPIKAVASGMKIALLALSGHDYILMVCTDRRLLMINQKLLKSKVEEIPICEIKSIERSDGIALSKMTIQTSGRKPLKLKKVSKDAAFFLCETVRKLSSSSNFLIGQEAEPTSVADELKELKEMLTEDLITQEDFDMKKRQLLGL